jgi:hypothetical protein
MSLLVCLACATLLKRGLTACIPEFNILPSGHVKNVIAIPRIVDVFVHDFLHLLSGAQEPNLQCQTVSKSMLWG